MRLTLRTLLAYLDDILDPADAHELGQKIEESEFASGLVHRIRSVTRKLRLGAPKLSGRGMGLDANTVAEYLDNTLPQDRVPDFEKVCLESDVHLAEVASCHQILTLVLGEPADVDPALRERIRALPGLPAGEVGDEGLHRQPTPPPVEAKRRDHRAPDDVPMLTTGAAPRSVGTTSSIRLLPIAATLVVAFLLALVALIAIGPLDEDHPILGRFFADAGASAQADPDVVPPPSKQAETAPASTDRTGSDRTGTGGAEAATTPPPSQPAAGGQADAGSPARPGEEPVPGGADVGPPEGPASGGGTFPLPPADTAPPAMETDGAPTPPPTTPPADARPGPEPAESGVAETTTPDTKAPVEAEPLARYMSELHVLARLDSETDAWLRLVTGDPIGVGQRVVALPTYRPQIVLSSGIQIVAVGPAELRLLEPDPDGTPGVALEHGRFLVVTDGRAGAALNLQFGSRASRVVFEDLDSTLAVEVQRYLPPGTNPEEVEGHWLIEARATVGRLQWSDRSVGAAVELAVGQVASMVDEGPPELSEDAEALPWLDPRNSRPIDRVASEQLEPDLVPNRPLTISLFEQVPNRLVEVRTLAIRSLALFGEFDPFVDALNARDLRPVWWGDLYDCLLRTLPRDKETAAHVRTTFERLRGEQGGELYRLLWGYSPQQLAEGAAESLVQSLSSPALDIRVLAYLNLNRVTEKTNTYRPEFDPKRQRRAILSWERDLERGEIKYKTPPLEPSSESNGGSAGDPAAGSANIP